MESSLAKRRFRHIYHHSGPVSDLNKSPRGWINPEGKFHETKEHWRSIAYQFKRPETRSISQTQEEIEQGERVAQLAYSLGWISLGHAGELNAIGHKRTFELTNNLAVLTLRNLLSTCVEPALHVELQVGRFDPSLGVHEDYLVKEYDLERFIKRGRLIARR
jgi:hypothetical protein